MAAKFYGLVVLSALLLVEKLLFSKAATITTNIDDPACPGDRLVYTCVSQGTSQRWRIKQNGELLADIVFIRGREPGSVIIRNPYTLTLLSAVQNRIESTVSVIATMTIHNTEVECTGIPLRDSITIKIASTPLSPLNLQFVVDEYYDHTSTVHFTWDAPDDDSQVDYYQYQLINETGITAYNTSNTTATISGIAYNNNVTFLLLSFNCVGVSSPLIETIHIAGCKEFSNTLFDLESSTFSQAPGAEVMLLCSFNMDRDVSITCQDDGQWEPNPDDLLCTTGTTSARSDDRVSTQVLSVDTLNPETKSPTSIQKTTQLSLKFLIPVYVLASIIIVCLCVVVGLAVVCKVYYTKHRAESLREVEIGDSDANREYYEIVADTIYETINTTSDDLDDLGMQVKMTNNDAYTENIAQDCSSMGINATYNEAYIYVTTNLVPMNQNSSYQAGHLLHCPNVAVHSDPSDGIEKQHKGTNSEFENSCTNTTECLQMSVKNKP